MNEPLTDLELDAMETENGQRAAAEIRELREWKADAIAKANGVRLIGF